MKWNNNYQTVIREESSLDISYREMFEAYSVYSECVFFLTKKENIIMTVYDALNTTQSEVENIIKNKEKYYLSYGIKKPRSRTKKRYIDAPQDRLKEIQELLLKKVLYKYKPHPICHGFVKGRSPVTNAQPHVGAKVIHTIDIFNFFNSIKIGLVKGMLKYLFKQAWAYDPYTSEDLENICQLLTYRGIVPQGAPTSPALSNLVLLKMDKDLKILATEYKFIVTRYADDITFSFKNSILHKASFHRRLEAVIGSYGLKVNKKKVRTKRYYMRMQVTGVVVNVKTNVSKTRWRNLRAQLHNIKRDNATLSNKEVQKLRGEIEWIKAVNPIRGQEFLTKFNALLTKPSSII